MKTSAFLVASILSLGALSTVREYSQAASGAARPFVTRIGNIALPNVEGRIDHFSVDVKARRLYVAALENRSLEVVDLATRRRVHTISNLNEPQGVLALPQVHRVFVCSRGDGTLRSFDTRTFQESGWVDLGRNSDNLRFDATTNRLYAGSNGEPGTGMFSSVDLLSLLPANQGGRVPEQRSPADLLLNRPRRADPISEIVLPSHPESFQIDAARKRAFINVPDAHNITVVDLSAKPWRVAARWPVPAKRNFPMAFDAASSRLFIASRNPPRVLAYDSNSGKLLAQTPCVGDSDDVYFDAARKRLYVIGGGVGKENGAINVFDASTRGALKLLARIPTAPRARTGIFIPALNEIVVAAPHFAEQRARLLIFRVD